MLQDCIQDSEAIVIPAAPEKETLACLVIDDPPLRPRFGSFEYARILHEMKEHRFFTEIAFIPWNYRRSDPGIVRLFASNPEYFALCIHGCNHLDNEFGGSDFQELSTLSSTAMWRMEQHKKRTGLPYDPVIVFPCGRFSSVAMQVMKEHGYVAAVNSILRATDGAEPPAIEYQKPVTNIYHDFPLFLRRYPKDKAFFIEDIALGRPILIVEHQRAFQNGYKAITDLVDWVNSLGNIRWTSLTHIAEHYLGKATPGISEHLDPPPLRLGLDARVFWSRFLSEARVNYLDTSGLVSRAFKMVRG